MTLNEYLEARKKAYIGCTGRMKGAVMATKAFRGILSDKDLLDELLDKLDQISNDLDKELLNYSCAYANSEEP